MTEEEWIRYHLDKLSESYATNIRKRICDTDIVYHIAQLRKYFKQLFEVKP